MKKRSSFPAICGCALVGFLACLLCSPAELCAQGGEYVSVDVWTGPNVFGPAFIDLGWQDGYYGAGWGGYDITWWDSRTDVRTMFMPAGDAPGDYWVVSTVSWDPPPPRVDVFPMFRPLDGLPLDPGYHVGTLTIDTVQQDWLGTRPEWPLMPFVRDNGWRFMFDIPSTDEPTYVDPPVAIGYDYFVDSGPNFASVRLPAAGDNDYNLWLWDSDLKSWFDSGDVLTAGLEYSFGAGGVDRFRILGIESWAGLDPLDTAAFETALWFTALGPVDMRQVPLVPVPGPVLLGSIGLSFAGWLLRRKAALKA